MGPSKSLLEAIEDDLNTPAAIATLHELANLLREGVDTVANATQLLTDCIFLGVDPFRFARTELARFDTAAIEAAIEIRLAARKAKDFKESDRIRDELLAKGVVLKDGPSGTTWEVKR
jgi:cysteinyl-tRNA synthetase